MSSSSAPVTRRSVRSPATTVSGEPTNWVSIRSATSARSASLHSNASASAGVGYGIAPLPVRMPCTHTPYGLASSRAVASSSATTASADTITYGSARYSDGVNHFRYASTASSTVAGLTW